MIQISIWELIELRDSLKEWFTFLTDYYLGVSKIPGLEGEQGDCIEAIRKTEYTINELEDLLKGLSTNLNIPLDMYLRFQELPLEFENEKFN